MTHNWVFGYASLITEGIRNSINITGKVELVEELSGIQREWDPNIADSKRARLTLKADKHAHANGVMIPVTESELAHLDRLNKGYTRVPLDEHMYGREEYLRSQRGVSSTVWVYLPTGNTNSSNQETSGQGGLAVTLEPKPIVQTYVDRVVLGAFHLGGKHFASHFVDKTEGWHHPWVNNRVYLLPDAEKVDAVLERVVGEAFRKRIDITS